MEVLDIAHLNGPLHIINGTMQAGSLDKLRVMIVRVCENLWSIATSDSVYLLNKLELLEVYNCRALEMVFDFERLKVVGEDEVRILPRLESLELKSLPGLECIWRSLPRGIQAFQSLKSVTVEDCHKILYLLSPPMAEMLVSLETLRLEKCNWVEEIIGLGPIFSPSPDNSCDFEPLGGMVDQKNGDGRKSKVQLPRLRRLELRDLENFKTFCGHAYDLFFPSLTKLWIERCPEMRYLCHGTLSAPLLRKIDLEKGQSVPFKDFNAWLKVCLDSKALSMF